LHLLFAAGWLLALDGGLSRIGPDGVWRFQPSMIAGVAIFFLVLFYLRALDEWKDFDYDRIYNPERPLVRGVVTFADLYWFLAGSALIIVAIPLAFPGFSGGSKTAFAILLGDLGYGLLLVGLERISGLIRDNMTVNLILTYPVNVALSIYAYAAYIGRTNGRYQIRGALLLTAFALAFLYYEFARKTSWPQHAKRGKRLYSTQFGVPVALALCTFAGVGAAALAAALLAPHTRWWFILLLPVVPVFVGFHRFLACRRLTNIPKPSAPMTPFAMTFLVLFYTGMIASAVLPQK
jgi:hypothetical protein